MSLSAKRRLLIAFLVAFALWPPAQFLLVQRYELNPWKFAGWAMYARPPARISVAFLGEGAEGRRPVRPGVVPAPLLERFRVGRLHFGRLARPDQLALAAFRRDPGLRRLTIRVTARRLVAGSDRLEDAREFYRYRRAGGGVVRDGTKEGR